MEAMGVSEILRQISSLSPEQRLQIIQRTREMLGAEIPDSFRQGMQEIAEGEVIELDDALHELDRPERSIVFGWQNLFDALWRN